MKDKVNQLFKDKLFLVMMVIGLLTAVAAVGVLTVGSTDENGQSPYLEVPGGELMAKENGQNGADQENTGDNAQAAAEASQEDPKAFAQKNTDENAGNNPLTDNENTAENKNIILSWRNNWDDLTVFFQFPLEIRKIIICI